MKSTIFELRGVYMLKKIMILIILSLPVIPLFSTEKAEETTTTEVVVDAVDATTKAAEETTTTEERFIIFVVLFLICPGLFLLINK